MILLADDDEEVLTAIRRVLKEAGVTSPVVSVHDGTEVISYIKGEGRFGNRKKFPLPSVLMVDLKMKRMTGLEVMEWMSVNNKLKGILVVVLSGHGELENVREAYRQGARSFLTKPCTLVDMQNLVKAYPAYWELKHSRSRDESA
jgi:CheY-like chemotaxis protein